MNTCTLAIEMRNDFDNVEEKNAEYMVPELVNKL